MVTTETRGNYRDGNSTADRALTILQMFTEQRPRVSATEVAEHLGVSRSTAYRYAQTLVRSSFLEEESGNGFRLCSKVMELARIARRSYGLSDLAIPLMRQLALDLRETVILTKRVGGAILCIEREEYAGQFIRISYERGSRLSLNAGASALVLLAWMSEEDIRTLIEAEPLPTYTSATLTEPDQIVARLAQIRGDGFAVGRGEVDPDALAVAAPIFDADGSVAAGLSVVGLRSRTSETDIARVTSAMLASANWFTEQLRTYTG